MAPAEQCSRCSMGWNADWPLPKKCGNTEYNKFIAQLSSFVNKEINDFRCSIVVMSDSLRDLRIFNTRNHEVAQGYISADGQSTESSDIHPL